MGLGGHRPSGHDGLIVSSSREHQPLPSLEDRDLPDAGRGVGVTSQAALTEYGLHLVGDRLEVPGEVGDAGVMTLAWGLVSAGLRVGTRGLDFLGRCDTGPGRFVLDGTSAAADIEQGHALEVLFEECAHERSCPGAGAVLPIRSQLLERVVIVELGRDGVAPARSHGGTATVEILSQLTPRQREVLQLFAEGLIAKEVAATLKISRRTAEFHKARIMSELGIGSTAELTQFAIKHGIISVE